MYLTRLGMSGPLLCAAAWASLSGVSGSITTVGPSGYEIAANITVGAGQTCAHLLQGTAICFGDGGFGRLGTESTANVGDSPSSPLTGSIVRLSLPSASPSPSTSPSSTATATMTMTPTKGVSPTSTASPSTTASPSASPPLDGTGSVQAAARESDDGASFGAGPIIATVLVACAVLGLLGLMLCRARRTRGKPARSVSSAAAEPAV